VRGAQGADPEPLVPDDEGGEPGGPPEPGATEPRVVPIGAAKPKPRKPDAESTELHAAAPAEADRRSMTRALLRRSWPWAAAGCLVLTIILANAPEKDTHLPQTQPYTVTTPDPGVSPGAAARKPANGSTAGGTKGNAPAGSDNVLVNMPGGAAGQPTGAAAQASSPPPVGPTGVPAAGLPSQAPPPPPTEEPQPSPVPTPCPTKKNGNCKKSHPPKDGLLDLPIPVLP
jgi:hypothetical protein